MTITLKEIVQKVAELALQRRVLEFQQRAFIPLRSYLSQFLKASSILSGRMIMADLVPPTGWIKRGFGGDNRFGLRMGPSEIGKYFASSLLNKIESSSYNNVYLPTLLNASQRSNMIGSRISTEENLLDKIRPRYGLSKAVTLPSRSQQPTERKKGAGSPRMTQPPDELPGKSKRKETGGTQRREVPRSEKSKHAKIPSISKQNKLHSSQIGSVPFAEVARYPRVLQAAIQRIIFGRFGQVNLLAGQGLSTTFARKEAGRSDSRVMPLQSYTIAADDIGGVVPQSRGRMPPWSTAEIPKSITKSTFDEAKTRPVPITSRVPIFALAHQTIARAHTGVVGDVTRYVSVLGGVVLGGIFPKASSYRQMVQRPRRIGGAKDVQVAEPAGKSSTGSTPQRMSKEILERDNTRTSPATFDTFSVVERDPLEFISALIRSGYPVPFGTRQVVQRTISLAYRRSGALIAPRPLKGDLPLAGQSLATPQEVEIRGGHIATHSAPFTAARPILPTGVPRSIAKTPNYDLVPKNRQEDENLRREKKGRKTTTSETRRETPLFDPIASLRQTYSRFTFDSIIPKGKTGVATATLVSLPSRSVDLFSTPPRKVRSKNRRDEFFDPFRVKEGSIDLPSISQLRFMLEEHAIKGMDHARTVPIAALSQTQVGPPGTQGLHRGAMRLPHPQVAEAPRAASSAEERPTEGRSHKSLSYGKSRTGVQPLNFEEKRMIRPEQEKNETISLRDLRKKMEQIFAAELRRYGL